jgi:iron complex transport system ATP-binding protein
MTAPLLDAARLGVVRAGRPVLDLEGIVLRAGEILAVVGANGAGKSTLLAALAGLVPCEGEVRLGGAPLAALSAGARAKRIGWLAQRGGAVWPLTIMEIVALGRLPHGRTIEHFTATDHAALARALALTGLEGLSERRFDTLSGGERARALVARALAVEADLLLVDEPVAALDPYHQIAVMGALKVEAARGAGVIAVLHDMTLAARFADRVLVLREGRATAFGPPREALTAAALARAFGIDFLTGENEGEPWALPWALPLAVTG